MVATHAPGPRERQKAATRQRIVDAAVTALLEAGYAATTTLEVQRRADVSRGALLHHFATRAELVAAAIDELVALNAAAIEDALTTAPVELDPIERAVRALRAMVSRPAYVAEMALWAAAGADSELRRQLADAERRAKSAWESGFAAIVGPDVTSHANYPAVLAVTTAMMRGTALTRSLAPGWRHLDCTLDAWALVVRQTLAIVAERPHGADVNSVRSPAPR